MTYKIQKGVPAPKILSWQKFPLADMKVGDSFTAPYDEARSVATAASRYGKRTGRKFITRREKKDVRCWRVE